MKRTISQVLSHSAGPCARSRVATAVCLALLGSAVAAAAQTWVPEAGKTRAQLDPRPGEISADQAVEASRAFFRKIGVSPPAVVPVASRLMSKGRPGGSIFLDYVGEADIAVDLRTGVLWRYENTRRESELSGGKLPRGPLLLGDALAAQNYAWSVARRIGVGRDCKLTELDYRPPGNPEMSSSFKYATISAGFQPMPFGYRIRGDFGMTGFTLDPRDGEVVVYGNGGAISGAYTTDSHEPVLKLSKARAVAEPLVKKYGVGLPANPDGETHPATKTNQLMFVHPNGEMGGIDRDDYENPAHLRLAWVLYYREDAEIWIDAADGKVLGGRSYAEDNKRAERKRSGAARG